EGERKLSTNDRYGNERSGKRSDRSRIGYERSAIASERSNMHPDRSTPAHERSEPHTNRSTISSHNSCYVIRFIPFYDCTQNFSRYPICYFSGFKRRGGRECCPLFI